MLVIEAMKMQNVLKASKAGKVVALHFKKGDSVSADDVILELD